METASRATEKASLELEALMLSTQTTLPQALKEIESAAAQFDALGFEIRDSTRRFGITAPGLPLTAKGGDAAGAEGVEGMAASTSAAGWGADGNPLLPGARAGEGLPGLPSVESSLNALQEFRERVEKGFGVDVDALLGRRRGEGAGGEQAGPAPANALTEFLERTGRQVAGGAGAGVDAASKQVMGALAAVRIVGQPKDGEEAKAWRERAVAEALARAEAAAEEARKAADRLFAGDPNWLTEAVSAPPEAAPTPQEIAQRLSAQATDKAAMRAVRSLLSCVLVLCFFYTLVLHTHACLASAQVVGDLSCAITCPFSLRSSCARLSCALFLYDSAVHFASVCSSLSRSVCCLPPHPLRRRRPSRRPPRLPGSSWTCCWCGQDTRALHPFVLGDPRLKGDSNCSLVLPACGMPHCGLALSTCVGTRARCLPRLLLF